MRLCAQRSELVNSLGETNSDMTDDGVGDAVLKPSNIGEGVNELGSLQFQHD